MRTRTPFLLLLGLSALSASAATFVTGGTVSGPTTSTDNAIVRFDGTTGRTIQNSTATIDDSGNAVVAGTITTSVNGINVGSSAYRIRQASTSVIIDSNSSEAVRFDSNQNTSFSGSAIAVGYISGRGASTVYTTLGSASSSYGAVGSNYYISGSSWLGQTADYVSQVYFESGGFKVRNQLGSASAGGAISWVDRFYITRVGNASLTPSDSSALTDFLINPTTKTSGNLFEVQVGGVSKASIDYAGTLNIAAGLVSGSGIRIANTAAIQWGIDRTFLNSPADGKLLFRKQGASTGVTLDTSTGDVLKIRTFADSADAALTASTGTFSGPLVHPAYTVATLPTAATYPYAIVFVSDATNAAGTGMGSAPTGGGSVKRAVYSDGSSWLLL